MITEKLTIKQLIEMYSDYLKSENVTDKKYDNLMVKFKLDMIDKYANGDYFIVDKVNRTNSGKMIVDELEFKEFMRDVQCGIASSLTYYK